jgi:hypothetical protein
VRACRNEVPNAPYQAPEGAVAQQPIDTNALASMMLELLGIGQRNATDQDQAGDSDTDEHHAHQE